MIFVWLSCSFLIVVNQFRTRSDRSTIFGDSCCSDCICVVSCKKKSLFVGLCTDCFRHHPHSQGHDYGDTNKDDIFVYCHVILSFKIIIIRIYFISYIDGLGKMLSINLFDFFHQNKVEGITKKLFILDSLLKIIYFFRYSRSLFDIFCIKKLD